MWFHCCLFQPYTRVLYVPLCASTVTPSCARYDVTEKHSAKCRNTRLGQLSRYSDSLQVGRFGVRNSVGARFSAPVQSHVQWAPPLLSGGELTDDALTAHRLLSSRLCMGRAMTLLKCHRATFTFKRKNYFSNNCAPV